MKLSILAPDRIGTIAPEIYGHFAEHIGGVIYDGIWVGDDPEVENIGGCRAALVEKLRAIRPPVVRWPGGCFAETYDWRDGVGPRESRPVRRNWWQNEDGRCEPNAFGTHEFIEFCRLIGAEPYLAANITSVTPLHIRDWIDYCNSPAGTTALARERAKNGAAEPFGVKYWGVGNETWGGGGNMTAETYAREFRKYAVVMENACPGIELIGSGANHDDWTWARDFLGAVEPSERHMRGLSLHYYCGTAGTATEFTEDEYYALIRQALSIERAIERNWGFVVGYGLERHARLVIDEWGAWHKSGSGPSRDMRARGVRPAPNNPRMAENLFEQQSTMRDALVAALTLNLFNNHCEKIMMANVAQLVNNLHALFLAGGRDCIETPTYYVYELYKHHQGGTALRVCAEGNELDCRNCENLPRVSASASVRDGIMTLTLANLSIDTSAELDVEILGANSGRTAEYGLLSAPDVHRHNTFEEPDAVKTVYRTGEFAGRVSVPAASVLSLRVRVGG